MNDQEGRRPLKVYHPSPIEWPHGYSYKYMYNQPEGPLFYNVDTPYSPLHSRTPDWVGLDIKEVAQRMTIPKPYRIIGPKGYLPTGDFIPYRLNIFIDSHGIITSLAYH